MDTNNYELMLVANVDRADQLLSRVEKSIKEANGASVSVERLGKKTLAYNIKKQTDATYFVISFKADGETIKPVWDKLKLEQEDLLRYLFLKIKDKKLKSKKVRKVSKAPEEMEEKPKVTVAVKKASKVKSKIEEVTGVSKVSKVKERKTKSIKSTVGKKGKSKK